MTRYVLVLSMACHGGPDRPPFRTDGDADADTDADTDADADADTDADAEPEPCTVFPRTDPWNTRIRDLPVHPSSDAYVGSIGEGRTLHVEVGVDGSEVVGIPFVVVPAGQPLVSVEFLEADESDPGLYAIPPEAPIEEGGDRRVVAVDLEGCRLYELRGAWPVDFGASWRATAGAIFDLRESELRPDGWTAASLSGLPVYPGLVRYEEVVERGEVAHALRMTVSDSRDAWIHPATDSASTHLDYSLPPMGLRLRLRGSYDCSGLSPEAQVLCAALKAYGAFVADEGDDWAISAAPDSRWDLAALADLDTIPGRAFEAVDTGPEILGP